MGKDTIILIIKDNWIKILINGCPHIVLKESEFFGCQAWLDDHSLYRYNIEFYTKTTSFLCEYDDQDKWRQILNLINDKL